MLIKTFETISKNDVSLAGGKGASLGEMLKAGLPVPSGFVITTKAYLQFYNQELPADVEEEIFKAFDNLKTERVAVRSSAVAEDSSVVSWAGQLESYLNVTKENLIDSIRKCWDSIKSERALSYAAQQNLPEDRMIVAVVVQKMVESEVSGVMFTVNPITKDADEMMIEAGYGLGEMLVQGIITPDNFLLNKATIEIKDRDIQTQDVMLVFQEGANKEIPVPENKRSQSALSDDQIKKLALLGKKIEEHYGCPQDIEWALEKDNFYIIQSRPITTLDQ